MASGKSAAVQDAKDFLAGVRGPEKKKPAGAGCSQCSGAREEAHIMFNFGPVANKRGKKKRGHKGR